MTKIRVAGLDGSLRNFGVTVMTLDTETMDLQVEDIALFETAPTKHKNVRASSDNLRRAQEIRDGVHETLRGCITCFAEVPSGGQSYDAVLGFGIVIGLYASLPIPLIEVSPSETKMAAVGARNAAKEEIIDWAFTRWPNAPWLTKKSGGNLVPLKKNEHVADAAAIVSAGIKTPSFRQTLAILNARAA